MSDLVAATITRLEGTSPLKMVAGLLSLAALVAPPVDKMPCAFVMPNKKTFAANARLNAVSQTGPQTIRILLFIGTHNPQGKDAFNPVQPVEDAVMARLLGWQPDTDQNVLLIQSAQLLDLGPKYLVYEMIFSRQFTVIA